MRFAQIDVFAESAYGGNPVAVFPDAGSLTSLQMGRIASEMNLSETTFVTAIEKGGYTVRIFTPTEELPFAGHPTLGTAWFLRHEGMLDGDRTTQRSAAGATVVTAEGEMMWFERQGTCSPDLIEQRSDASVEVARAVGLKPDQIGLDAGALGGNGRLLPARSNAGLTHLHVPVRDIAALAAIDIDENALSALDPSGAYCFTWDGTGLRARGLFPGLGVAEDPATGSAAAGLGLYLAERIGDLDIEVTQGSEIGRPSKLHIRATPKHVAVGGRCEPVLTGELLRLP